MFELLLDLISIDKIGLKLQAKSIKVWFKRLVYVMGILLVIFLLHIFFESLSTQTEFFSVLSKIFLIISHGIVIISLGIIFIILYLWLNSRLSSDSGVIIDEKNSQPKTKEEIDIAKIGVDKAIKDQKNQKETNNEQISKIFGSK
jgi:hypothetical protein